MQKISSKKLVTLVSLLSISLIVGSCSKHEPTIKEEEKPTEIVVVEEEKPKDVEILEGYKEVDTTDENKFLGTLISKTQPKEYQGYDIPLIDERATTFFGDVLYVGNVIDELDAYAVSASDLETRAYTVMIAKAKQGKEEILVEFVNRKIQEVQIRVREYPDQLYAAENYILEQVGDYLVLVISDNGELVYNEIKKGIENTDLSDIQSISLVTNEEREQLGQTKLDKDLEEVSTEVPELEVIKPEVIDGAGVESILMDNVEIR